MGHELHLLADIRVASADVRFGQDENTHGRFPGGGSTVRFPHLDDPCLRWTYCFLASMPPRLSLVIV